MAAGGNQQPTSDDTTAPAPAILPNYEHPTSEAQAAAQTDDPWINTADSWIHDTAASAAMSWAQDEPWDVGYGSSIPYQSYFTVAREATSPDSGNDSFGCLLESGGKDCDMPEALIAQAKNECLMARLDT